VLVKDRMTPHPLVVVTPDTPVTEAQRLMQDHNIRHVPVVTENQNLVGLLTRETLLQAIPWSAASLSALETQFILSKITAGRVMLRDVITVTEDVAVEEHGEVLLALGGDAEGLAHLREAMARFDPADFLDDPRLPRVWV